MVAATLSFPVDIDVGISNQNIVTPEDYGGAADSDRTPGNGTDNSDAFDAVFAAAIADPTKVIHLQSGVYRLTRPIKHIDTGIAFVIRGQGGRQTYLYGDFKGAGEGILDLSNSNANSYSTNGHRISGLAFISNGVPGDPIGLKLENAFEAVVDDINIPTNAGRPLANSGVVCTNDNNSKWSNIRSQAGSQPLVYDTSGIEVSFTTGSAIVTADADIFVPDMIGKSIYFAEGGNTGQHAIWTSFISSVQSPTQATLTTNAPSTASGVRFAIGDTRGATVNGSKTLILDTDIGLTADWVGMSIHVFNASHKSNAGVDGMLSTKIEDVNGTAITMADAATVTKADTSVLFAPNIFIGSYEGDPVGRQTNHSWWNNVHCEGFQGAGLLINKAIYLTIDNLKVHGPGYGTGADWPQCYHPLVISEAKTVFLRNVQAAYGIKNSRISITGSRGLVTIDNFEMHHATKDKAYISCTNVSADFRLIVDPLWMTYGSPNFTQPYNPVYAPLAANIERAVILNNG